MLKTIFTALLCLFTLTGKAQMGKLFNTDNQLSSSFANQVLQDKHGYIWIATRNGLNSYDGYKFTVTRSSDRNSRGFSNDYINCMAQDQQGNIILGTNNALIFYDGKRYRPIPINIGGKHNNTYINHIICRKNGEVWACTSGMGLVRMKGQDAFVPVTGSVAALKYIYNATEDHLGRLWIITEDGRLNRLEANGKLTAHFKGTDGLKVMEVKEDRQGNIYMATNRQGLYVMKQHSDTFTKIPGFEGCPMSRIFVASDNQIYIGSNGQGIKVYNPVTHEILDNPFFTNRANISKSKVTSIIEDHNGNFWISMLQKGVFMQPRIMFDFKYLGYRLGSKNTIGENCVTSILKSRKGDVWVGTDKDGLYRIGDLNKPMTSTTHVISQDLAILCLCEDQYDNIWLGCYQDGCGYVDPSGKYHPVDLNVAKDLSVFDIKADKFGNLWIATMGQGLICKRPDGSTKIYKQTNDSDNNPHINALPNNYLTKLSLSTDHRRLYVSTSVGLACLDTQKDSWLTVFGVNCINKGAFSHSVYADSKGNVWYGTERGVFFTKAGEKATGDNYMGKLYDTSKGLPNNSISFITEDANGVIWIGTTHGLCRFNPKRGSISNFFVESGLQSNEFSDGAACVANNGRLLLLGGTGGINWFDPQKVKQHPWKAKVFVSKLIVGNDPIYPGMESGRHIITDKRIINTDYFDLAKEDNSFTIQLSTFTYSNTEQIAYAYSINGDKWHQIQQGINEVTFSHMPAGRYHFRIKALNNTQESDISEFCIEVHPAWYASGLAKLIYFLIILSLGWYYISNRKKKEKAQLLLQKHIHAEEMGEAKLRFFMNISHEIRTPLTLIITPLLSLIKEDKEPHRQGIYEIIRKNSERIMHLINQMMDLRKIDKGQMVMSMSKTDLVSFINDEYELFQQQAVAKNITFTFEHDCDDLDIWIDRNNFDKVLMNLLSNAFKFTKTGGKILIKLTKTEHHAYISVKDNGIGIPKDKLETIFQRFYQSPTDPNDRNIGTGIGLDLTRSLVELHYGTIVARNNEDPQGSDFDHGTTFMIRLPLGKDHLKPDEIVEEEEKAPENLLEEELVEEVQVEEMENEEKEVAVLKGGKSTIAIVEDDEDIRTFLQEQLGNDFKTITYQNGKEAYHEILRLQPDLVISDIMMPEMDGNTLCNKLKSNVNTNHIPIILLTAKSREEDQLAGLEMGADAYILKPFNMDILRRTIINLLTVRRTLRNKFSGNESQESRVEKMEMQAPDEALMERIMQVINENLSDSDLSVDMISQKVGISRVHLHRKMKELTNQTPHSFVRNIRLKQAARLLKNSHRNITEVMYMCGFSNAASFSTMFKNLYGCSPREYMNREKENPET